ncbi:Polyprenyl synthetase [Paenibacillus curdlanolyticus YK9]|uniref:Polyprenyl synthetase n=1 Tax=Paenibacillus curdlanolyticus YK9 TaxID=717606 RepID=E0I9Z6_9BACL|nr:polyprenyl synthetase family protein [Paenibacillus curdlanolyticus]EFM10573.1 Polyprenyl synthetase [Paenibacillus curdlanolyticus YK9]
MSTVYATINARLRTAGAGALYEPELRQLAEQFIAYKQSEGGIFGELTALHCRMLGGDEQLADAGAAAVELMILALDIYDDLQDKDNPKVPWSQIDPAIALNVAIGLQSLSMDLILTVPGPSDRKLRAATYLNQGVLRAVNGQHTDLRNEPMTEEECLQMIEEKSGSLVAAACLVGAALATDEHAELIGAYGRAIGIAAQLRNDVEGMQRWETRNDLLERKQTLPIQYVLEQQSEEAALVRSYYDGEITQAELLKRKAEIMDYIQGCGSVEYGLVHAKLKQYEAEAGIDQLPVDEMWKERLRGFA